MKRRNKQKVFNPCTLDKLVRANKQIKKLKSELTKSEKQYGELLIDKAETEARWRILRRSIADYPDRLEYLNFHVLNSKNMEELEKAKEAYKKFERYSFDEFQKAHNELKTVNLLVNGKNITKDVLMY